MICGPPIQITMPIGPAERILVITSMVAGPGLDSTASGRRHRGYREHTLPRMVTSTKLCDVRIEMRVEPVFRCAAIPTGERDEKGVPGLELRVCSSHSLEQK
jgi:hypothetical protein